MLRPSMANEELAEVATSTWGWPHDPRIYGRQELDGVPVLEAIRDIRERTGARVTATTLVTRAIAQALSENPSMNTRLASGGSFPAKAWTSSSSWPREETTSPA